VYEEDRAIFLEIWHGTPEGAVWFSSTRFGREGGQTIAWNRIFPQMPSDAYLASIAERADEITAFLQVGLSREAVERELEVTPVSVRTKYSGLPVYRFDLMAVPGYEFIYEYELGDWEGLRAGEVGIIVFVSYDNSDAVERFSLTFYSGDSNFRGRDSFWGETRFSWRWFFIQYSYILGIACR